MTEAMTLEELTALERIKQVKGAYCRTIDTKDWDGYANLFTKDAVMNVDTGISTQGGDPKPQPEVRGRENIKEMIARLLVNANTVHQVHTPEIELLSATSAKAVWAMEDVVEMPGFHLHAFGHYHEHYVIEDGRWRISSLHLTRTRIEMLNGEASGPPNFKV